MFYSSYGMGWVITSYRNHLLLSHSGGFDGFGCYVSLMPRDNIGCVVFCNMEGTSVPYILTYILFDRLLGLSEICWNERMKERISKGQEAGAKPQTNDSSVKAGKPRRPLEEYCGRYEHPAYGVLIIEREGQQLRVAHNDLQAILAHCYYDIFETKDKAFGEYKFSFISDQKGDIDRIEVPFEPSVKCINFKRLPEK